MTHLDREVLEARARRIRLFAMDVDGVLTDGSIVYSANGEQIQGFHVRDGLGLKLLQKAGIHAAVISSRSSAALTERMRELGIEKVFQGRHDKLSVYETLKTDFGVEDNEIAYMGDDWLDLPLLKRAGLAIVVADAAIPLSDHAHYVTANRGGRGAVREACELILKAQNKWAEFLSCYLAFE